MTAEETGDFHDEDEILEAVLEELDGEEDAALPDGDPEGERKSLWRNTKFEKC